MELLEQINTFLDKKFGQNAFGNRENPICRMTYAFDKIRCSEMGASRYWLHLNPQATHEDIIFCLDKKTYHKVRHQRALENQKVGRLDYYFLHHR